MFRVFTGFLVLLAGVALLAPSSRGADAKFKVDGDKTEKSGGAKTDTSAKKDPLDVAFALPKGVVLRPDQQSAFDKMKADMEPKLKEALDKVEKATADADKSKAAREALHVREDIKKQIKDILAMPASGNNQPQPQKHHKRRW